MAAPVPLREAITAPACGTATYSRAPHATQCSYMSTTSEGSERILFVIIPLPFLACCELNQSMLSPLGFFSFQISHCLIRFLSRLLPSPFYSFLIDAHHDPTIGKPF